MERAPGKGKADSWVKNGEERETGKSGRATLALAFGDELADLGDEFVGDVHDGVGGGDGG